MPIEKPSRKGRKKKTEQFAAETFPLAKEVLEDPSLGILSWELLNLPGKIEIFDVTAELEALEVYEQAEMGEENDHSPAQ